MPAADRRVKKWKDGKLKKSGKIRKRDGKDMNGRISMWQKGKCLEEREDTCFFKWKKLLKVTKEEKGRM